MLHVSMALIKGGSSCNSQTQDGHYCPGVRLMSENYPNFLMHLREMHTL